MMARIEALSPEQQALGDRIGELFTHVRQLEAAESAAVPLVKHRF